MTVVSSVAAAAAVVIAIITFVIQRRDTGRIRLLDEQLKQLELRRAQAAIATEEDEQRSADLHLSLTFFNPDDRPRYYQLDVSNKGSAVANKIVVSRMDFGELVEDPPFSTVQIDSLRPGETSESVSSPRVHTVERLICLVTWRDGRGARSENMNVGGNFRR